MGRKMGWKVVHTVVLLYQNKPVQRCQVMVQQEGKAEKPVLLNPNVKGDLLFILREAAAALSTVWAQPQAWGPPVSEGPTGVISPFSYLSLDWARELCKLRWGSVQQGKSPLGMWMLRPGSWWGWSGSSLTFNFRFNWKNNMPTYRDEAERMEEFFFR